MYIDKTWIICISPETWNKIYQLEFAGNFFALKDRKVLVFHKKQILTKNLKDVWQGMSVFFANTKKITLTKMPDLDFFLLALTLFESFDENDGQKYCFLYKKNSQELKNIISIIDKIEKNHKIKYQYQNWISKIFTETKLNFQEFINNIDNYNLNEILWFIRMLGIIYWKYQTKKIQDPNNFNKLNQESFGKTIISNIKIQIPLFWQYLSYQENFDTIFKYLFKNFWLFSHKSILNSNDWIIYQVSITDNQFLNLLTFFYKKINLNLEYNNLSDKYFELINEFCKQNWINNCLSNQETLKLLKRN